jgi:hypothetical protein
MPIPIHGRPQAHAVLMDDHFGRYGCGELSAATKLLSRLNR